MKNTIFYGNAVALNCNLTNLADGTTLAAQPSPFGEFTLHDGGKMNGTVQHCTRAAFEAMVANWKAAGSPEILVDVDHNSATGRSTEAAAWAKNLRVEDCGLCADFELTPRGRELIGGRQYRFVSPGWTLATDGTPLALCSVGLTNTPTPPVKPVVNADDAGGRDPDDPKPDNEGHPTMDIKMIAAALGLPETATEEEILAAIKAMKQKEADAAAAAADAEAAKFACAAAKCGKIAANAKAAVMAAYRQSPEVAKQMLNSLAAPAPLPDFTAGKTPAALNAARPGADADPVAVYNAYCQMAEGTEKDAYLAANAAKIEAGYAKACGK